jgi:membrane protein DedA with SNARE-associated domain
MMNFDDLNPLTDWLAANPGLAGFAIFLISLAESLAIIGTLIPGTLVMGAIGVLIGTGILPGIEMTLWAIAGAIVGDGLSYWLGYHYHGHIRVMWPFRSYPALMQKGEAFFLKYGGMSVFMGRFIGPIRPIIPVIAGMMNMPPARFTIANVLSAIGWAPAYMMPGIIFGALSMQLAPQAGSRFLMFAVAVLLALWCLYYLLKWLLGMLARWIQRHFVKQYSQTRLTWLLAGLLFILIFGTLIVYTRHYWFPAALPPQTTLNTHAWWSQQQSIELSQQNINIQWAGDLNAIEKELISQGWEVVPKPDMGTIINRIAAKNLKEQLPLFPHMYLNRKAVLIMTKRVGHPERLVVLRLWDANIQIESSSLPLWVGGVTWNKSQQSEALDTLTPALTAFIWKMTQDEGKNILLIRPQDTHTGS